MKNTQKAIDKGNHNETYPHPEPPEEMEPDEQDEQEEDVHPEQFDFPPANTDITFCGAFAPHFGQESFFSSIDEKIKLSKIFLHFLHRS